MLLTTILIPPHLGPGTFNHQLMGESEVGGWDLCAFTHSLPRWADIYSKTPRTGSEIYRKWHQPEGFSTCPGESKLMDASFKCISQSLRISTHRSFFYPAQCCCASLLAAVKGAYHELPRQQNRTTLSNGRTTEWGRLRLIVRGIHE